ncbi:Site-specific DNA recombinase [Saccharopolyspora kobensis]|uniref:Site-specific DNA recombinase n=2 Tax=cellular organisms TaxID=131567 RepID=A0ABY1E4K1_9PSEU|nr:recombinase family protein [Saccharopolyspora kobensis]SFE69772.1 Site-specific DNA recombinase [Saccharopolyspora kobensis]
MATTARIESLRAVPKAPSRVVIYLRQSSYREESISLELQENSAREYCARKGYRIVDVIADPGVSGRAWHRRKGVQRALGAIHDKQADVIVLWRWSRLARHRLHFAVANDTVEKLGGRIESSAEPIDLDTAAGRFQRGMLGEFAAFQSDMIGEQWKDAHERRRRLGLPSNGRSRYGYVWLRPLPALASQGVVFSAPVDGGYLWLPEGDTQERYEIDPEQGEVVEWMYKEYIAGTGRPGLMRELNRLDITNNQGKPWTQHGIATVLDSGFAAGLLVNTAARYDGERQIYAPFSEYTWEQGAHEPIIDPDLFERYREIRLGRANTPPRRINPTNPWTGLVGCGDCTLNMRRKKNSRGTGFGWLCQSKEVTGKDERRATYVQENRLEQFVKEWLGQLADDIGAAAESARAAQRTALKARMSADTLQAELDGIEKQLGVLRRQLVAERMSEDEYDQTRAELIAERDSIAAKLARAEQTKAAEPVAQPTEIARGLLEEWNSLPLSKKREMLGKLIKRIVVTPHVLPRQPAHLHIVPTWDEDAGVDCSPYRGAGCTAAGRRWSGSPQLRRTTVNRSGRK